MLLDDKLAWISEKTYNEIYENSIKFPNEFWRYHAQDISWIKQPDNFFNEKTKEWLSGGVASVCYNCVDRHAFTNPEKPAIVWHGDDLGERREISYGQLYKMVLKMANVLRNEGIGKNDVVGIYLPMIPEAIAMMHACSRIGAIHMVVFAGFSPEALAHRLKSSNAKLVVTVNTSMRSGKKIELLKNVEVAVSKLMDKPKILTLDEISAYECDIDDRFIPQDNKSDLFILYTSGSTGKPKGIVHSALQYMLYVSTTFKVIFGLLEEDICFCTSDIGWITGHSYVTYAPLFYGNTIVIFDGNPTYPEADRYWDIVEKERVSIFYSSPTAIRSLQTFDNSYVKKHDLSSLRVLGSVGEPINESAWNWYFEVVGGKKCPIMDTWWQTESGGIILSQLRNLEQIPGIAGKPFFGVSVNIVTSDCETRLDSRQEGGALAIANSWPGMCRDIIYECVYSEQNDSALCRNIFERDYIRNGMFMSGDGAYYVADNNIKVFGRLDDVINVSGHRFGTAEFEEAINKIEAVKDCAVVAVCHEIKGQTPFAYVVLDGRLPLDDIIEMIIKMTRNEIGPIAKPDFIAVVDDLPRTRSGKIVRRLLRDIAQNKPCETADLSSVVNKEAIVLAQRAVKNAVNCPDFCILKRS